jgi:hypothetical protein
MKVEIPGEIVDGVRERQKAVEAAFSNFQKASDASFEASRAYCDAKTPDGFRGDYLVPLGLFIESAFKVWLDFLGGDKKKLLRLQADKKEKEAEWEKMLEERDRKERELDGYVEEYLKSIDSEYEDLAEKFSALILLLKAVNDFHKLGCRSRL